MYIHAPIHGVCISVRMLYSYTLQSTPFAVVLLIHKFLSHILLHVKFDCIYPTLATSVATKTF